MYDFKLVGRTLLMGYSFFFFLISDMFSVTSRFATMGNIIIASPIVMMMNGGLCMMIKLSR